MAQSIELPVSLGLQQAESQVNHLRKILNEAVKIDSTAFRGLSQALQKAENDVAKLKSQMNTAFQSASGSKKFLSDYDKLFESLATIGNRFGFLKESEMIFSPENAEAIKNARTEMAQLSDEIQQIKSGKVGKLFEDDSVASIREVREVANDLGVTLSKTTFQDFGQKISGAMTNAKKDLDDTRKQIELLKEAAKSADLKKDSIFSQLNIDKLMGNTAEVIDKNGAKTLREQIAKLYEEYGLTDVELGKNIKAGSNIDQIFIAEEERVRASSEKYIGILQEQKNKIQEEIDKFDEGLKQSGGEGKRANWETKLAYIDEIKQKFAGLLTFSDVPASVLRDGTGITKYVESFKQELINGMKDLSTDDIIRVLQEKVQVIFSNASTKSVITDLGSFKQQITVMMKETFGDLNLGDVTSGISVGWDFDKAIEMVVANIKTALQNLDPKELEGKAAQYEATLKKLESASKTVSDTERASTGSLKEKEAAFQALVEEVTKYVAAQLGITTGQVQEVLRGNADAANQGRTALEGYIQSLNKLTQKQQALGNIQSAVNRWMGFWQVLNMTKSAISEMKQHIQELDTVMTSISVVTNFSQEDLWGQISQYSEIARQYGVAIKGVYEVSQIYYQQGLQQNDVMTLTTETLKMARIAGLDYATAADYMTTAIRGFKLEMTDAAHVTDVFSALAATTASSTEEIAVAISKTASSAEAVGASFEATSAMMATMISTTRESATNIGTALKSVISRYGEMTSDPSKTVDSEGEEMSLNRVDKALQTVGITIHDTAGQFRDFDDVMLELMEKWDSLDSLSQRYIATLMAGNRQQSRFLALVSNVDEYKKALEIAMDSEGTGELQTLKTLDSIDAKIEKMKVTIQEFYTSSGLEELYKTVIDTITNIISAANGLPKVFNKFPAQALAVGMSLITTVKSVLTLIIAQIQLGLEKAKGTNTNFLVGLVQQYTQKGREAGQQFSDGVNSGLKGFVHSKAFVQIANIVGSAMQLVGSGIFTQGLSQYGASTSHDEDVAAVGQMRKGAVVSALGGVASGAAMGFASAGPLGALAGGVASLVTQIPTLITAFGTNTETLARKIELDKKAETKAKEELSKDKGEVKSLEKALSELEKLKDAQYDSAEAAKEYTDYMNQLGDQYPNLIDSINQTGDAIINVTSLELALAEARGNAASSTIGALKAEQKRLQDEQEAARLLGDFDILGQNTDYSDLLLEYFGEAAAKNAGGQRYQMASLVTAYLEDMNLTGKKEKLYNGVRQQNPQSEENARRYLSVSQQRLGVMNWAIEHYEPSNMSMDSAILEPLQSLLYGKVKDYITAIPESKLLAFLDLDSVDQINQMNGSQLLELAKKVQQYSTDIFDSTAQTLETVGTALVNAEISSKVQSKLNTMVTSGSQKEKDNAATLQNYITLMSFIYSSMDNYEDYMGSLEEWILQHQSEAQKLLALDYSTFKTSSEIDFGTLPEVFRSAFIEQFEQIRDEAVTLYNNQLNSIFGQENQPKWLAANQFTNKTLTVIQSDLKQYQSFIEKQQYAQAEAYLNNMEAIYGPKGIGSLSGENQTKAYDIIKDLDLSDPEALRSAAETFAGMGSGFEGLSEIFTNAALRWTTNAATLLEQLASTTKDTAKSIESSLSDMSKVFKYSEALEKAQALMDANEGVKFKDLFTYDKDLGGYVKTAKVFQLEMAELQNQQVEGISLAITDMTETLPSIFNDKDFINLANSGRTIETGQVKEKFAELTHTKEGEANFDRLWLEYTQIIEAFRSQDKDWNTFITGYINEHGTQLQLQLNEINNMSSQMASLQLESFDYASIVSGKGTIQSKESMQALLTQAIDPAKFKLNQERFNEEYAKLITGDLDSWNTYIDELNTKTGSNIAHADKGQANRARFESLTSLYQKIASGDVIWDALTQQEQELLNSVEGVNLTEGASTAQIGAAADNVWAAIIKLINAGAGTLNEVADTIAGKADKDFKDSNAGKQYNLLTSYKDGFTSQEAQELGLLDNNGKLKAEFSSYLERDSNGNWITKAGQNAASVISYLASKLNISIDKTTDEYKDAIKTATDEEIAKNESLDWDKGLRSTLKEIFSGQEGDQINISKLNARAKSRLSKAGYNITGNILTIGTEQAMNNAAFALEEQIESGDAFWEKYQFSAKDVEAQVRQLQATMAQNAAFEGIVGEQFNQSAAEALSMALQNTTEYSKVQSLMTEMGFKWDQAAQVWKASATSIARARAKITSAWGRNEISDEEYWNLIAQLNETADAINPKTKQDNTILDMLSNYTSATEAMRAAFNTNFMNEMIAQGAQVTDFFKANDNGTYDIDVGALKSFLDSIGFEYDEAAMSQIQTITDSYLNNIKTATTYTTQGASSLADVDAFKQSYADIVGKTLSADAFSYNSALQSFVLGESYMDEYINAQRKKLHQLNYSEEFIDQYIKDQTDRAIQDSIALDGFLNATSSTKKSDEANKLIQQIRGLSKYTDIKRQAASSLGREAAASYQADQIQKLLDLEEKATTQEESSAYLSQIEDLIRNGTDEMILRVLESGGQAAVDLLKEIKPNASSSELEAVYNNAINKLRTAQEDLGKGVGETISGLAADIGEVTGALDVVRLDDGTAVITAVHDMVDAYATIYTQMKETAGHTIADLNNAYVQLLTAQDQKSVDLIEALNNASGMTYEAIGQIFTRYGIELEQALLNSEDAGIARVGYNKIAITDFTKFKGYIEKVIGHTIEVGTQEYLDAYSAYVDSQINMRNQGKNNLKTAFDQLKSVTEAKVGDLLNVTYLEDAFNKSTKTSKDTLVQIAEKFGASIKDGILTISKYTDVPGLLQAVAEEAGRAGLLIPEQLAELTDAIAGMLSNITSLISSGVTGTLNNTNALSLQNWAEKQGLQPLEFNQTAEGLQLTADSLALVYAEMKRVDSLQAQSLLPTIIESNDRYSTLASTLQAAAEVTQRIDFTRATITNPSRTVMGDVGAKGVALITPVLPDGTELGDDWAKTLATKYANGEINLNTKLQGSDGRELSYTLADVSRGLYTAENAVQQATSAMQSYNEAAESAAGANKDFTASLDSLTAQSSLMSDIVLNKLTDPGAMNFMSDKLPDNYQVAINAWENASKAIKTLTTAGKKGYIGVEDFYNIVNTSAGLLEAAGKEFNIKGMNAAELMEAACQNLKVVDGDLKIDLSSAGLDMVSGVDDLKNNLTDGVHELADAEVAILDAEIQVLEVLAAMEAMGDMVVDVDNNGISFELNDMFTFDDFGNVIGFTEDMQAFLDQMQGAIETSDELKKAVYAIQVNGTTLYDLFYGTTKEWEKTFGSAEAASKFMQKLSKIDWGTDINTIQTQIVNAMKDLGQNLVIDVGDNGLVGITATGQLFNIDLDDKDVAKQAQQAVNAFRTQHPDFFEGTNLRDNVKQLINELNNPDSNYVQVDLQYTLKVITGEIKIEEEKNDKGQKTNKFVGEYAGVKFRADNIGDVEYYIKQAIDLENQGLSKIEFNEKTGEVSGTLSVGAARIKVTKNGDKTTIETNEINGKRYNGDTVEGAVKWLAQQGYADNSLAGKTWSIDGTFYEVIQDNELGLTYTFTRSSDKNSWLYNGQTFTSYDEMAQYVRDIVPLEQGLSNDWHVKEGKQYNKKTGHEVKIWTSGTAEIEYDLETGKITILADGIHFKSRAEADTYLTEKAMAEQQKDSGGEITDNTSGGKTIKYTTDNGDTYEVEYNSTEKVKTHVTMQNGYNFDAYTDTELAMGLAAAAAIAKQKAGELPELDGNQGTVTIHTDGGNYEVILDDTGTVTVTDPDGKVEEAISEEVTKNLNQSKIDTNLKATISTAITEALSALPEAINSIEPSNITSVSEALSGISSALAAVVGDSNWAALIAQLENVANAAANIKLPAFDGNNGSETPTPSGGTTGQQNTVEPVKAQVDMSEAEAAADESPEIGENVSLGLAQGIVEALESIISACSNLAEQTLAKLQAGLKEHSPSEATDEMGQNLDAGLAQGIEKEQGTVVDAGTAVGTAVIEAISTAITKGMTTLSEGIAEAVESVDKSYAELETKTEQVAGSIRSHWEALVNQITAAVSLIQSLVQSLQEKISITWTIGSEGGTSDSSGFGSGTGIDPNREMTALTEYMDKMLSTMEHNKENDTFKVTMPALTIDTSKTEINIDDIGTKIQEEATKNPVESLTIPVGAVTVDLAGASVNIGENSVSTDENSQVTLESVKGVVGTLGDELDMTLLPQDLGEQSVKEGTKITISNPINAVVGKLNLEFSDASEITVPDDAEKPEIDIDVKPAEDKITELQEQIDGIKQDDELPKINVDITEANTNLTTIQTLITDIANAVAALTISIPTDFVTLFTSLTLNNINTTLANIIEKKTIPIKISLDAKNVLSELGKILQKLTEIQEKANISINGGVNGKTPEEGETPKEGETSQENQPTTTTTEVSQQTKVTTPGGTEIEMNAKVTATEVDGSQAPAVEMPVEADSVTANSGINPVPVPAEAESVDVPSGTTVAIQASIDVGEAGQSLSLTATYTVTTTGDIPADKPNLKATYIGVNGGGYIPGDITAYVTYIGRKGGGYSPNVSQAINATGNIGLAKAQGTRTLMGELGPELVVSNGRYFVAGQNGAEMVDLDKDAIVFNHLQTEQLLKNGMSKERGRAVTNERNAVAFAKGNISGGPAMASASAALAVLKQIRSMWQALLSASAKDLAGAGGSGGGGGGGKDKGGNGSDAGRKSFIEDVERWYNLMQEIAKLEKVINHEETLRAKLESDLHKNGSAYYKSQKESLSAIQKEIKAQEELNISRREYFNQRRKQLNEDNGPFNQLYEFDPQGQLKYKDDTTIKGSKATNGYAFLADLMAQDPNTGKPKYTVEQQYKILKKAGFAKYMKYDSSGNEIKLGGTDSDEGPSEDDYNTYYSSMVQAFWDRVEAQKSEMQTLYDTVADGENNLLELEQQRNELLEAMYDNQKELENSVLNAIEDMRQREIDALQDERDKLEEATGKYIEGLSDALDKERQMYDTQENQNELDTKKRRLGILQRSGASAEDIYSLQKEITESEKNMYFDAQQAQIDAIQQASDLEIERLDTQIQIMQDTLDFQKEMGLLWYQVYEVMSKSGAKITSFVTGNDSSFWAKSPLEQAQTYEKTLFKADQWKSFATDTHDFIQWTRDSQTADALSTYSDTMSKQHDKDDFWKNNKERYEGKFTEVFEETGDRTKAATAASQMFETDKAWNDRETTAGNRFVGSKETEYVDIDDTYHWVYTYEKEKYTGLNEKYKDQEQLYFKSREKKKHVWGSDGLCTKCGHKKPKEKSSSNGGGGGSRSCDDNCAGVCKGQLSGGTSCSKNCANNCSGGCKTSCQGSCKGGCGDGSTKSGKTTCNHGCIGTCKGFSGSRAAGGYVGHGIYELGEQGTETVLTAQQTRVLRNNILSNKPNSLVSLLKTYNEGFSMNQRYGLLKSVGERMSSATNNTSGGIIIENATVNMNVQKIANDYDAKRAGEQALNEMLRIANKTSAANNIRR